MKKEVYTYRLRLGAILHFMISIGHFACLFFPEEAFKATRLCFDQVWLLYAVTIAIALAFAVAGLYALSATGDVRRLPLQRIVVIAIVVVYSLRAALGIGSLVCSFSFLQLFSSLIPAFLVWCYLPAIQMTNGISYIPMCRNT